MIVRLILLLFFCLLIAPKIIFAQDGGHKEEKHTTSLTEKTTSLNDSIYSVGDEDTELLSIERFKVIDSPFSNNSLGGISLGEDIIPNEPMERFKQKTNSVEHDQHKTQHVEESLHDWVSPNAKGYSVAISMTILSGLVFTGLTFSRIGEKS
jgi:hypothetical protein